MRAALILSLLLAVLAAIFALQNPGYTDLSFGPYDFTASTALTLILAFGLGVVVGSLATLPARLRDRRRVKTLEKRMAEARKVATPPPSEPPPPIKPEEPSTRRF